MRRGLQTAIAAPLALLLLLVPVAEAQNSLPWKRPTVTSSAPPAGQHSQQRFGAAGQAVRVVYEDIPAEPQVVATRTVAPAGQPPQPTAMRTRVAQYEEELPAGGEAETVPTPATPKRAAGPVYQEPMPQSMSYGPEMMGPEMHGGSCPCGDCDTCPCEPGCGFAECGCGVPDCGCGVPECGCPVAPFSVGGCGDACCGDCVGPCHCGSLGRCAERGAIPLILYIPPIMDFNAFVGVHAFRNPLDYPNGFDNTTGSNFGIHEGLNAGGKMAWLPFPGLGYQIGFQAVHSRFSGDSAAGSSNTAVQQQFLTAGLFRRCAVGLNYGLVYDYMNDDRPDRFTNEGVSNRLDFGQVRGLISIRNNNCREVGFMFATGGGGTNVSPTPSTTFDLSPADQYSFFYRFHGRQGGEITGFAGWTDNSKGLFGANSWTPLNDRWSLNTAFTYMIPEDKPNGAASLDEGWNLGVNLVWHYGCTAKSRYRNQFRPMFDVADNGSMIIDRRP